jgi:ADP-heptose:LPS heptosyltransferase
VSESPQRFSGEILTPSPHVGIVFCDSIGDFVVSLPLMRSIVESYPSCQLDYFGGPRTAELEAACSLISQRFDLFGDVFNLPDLLNFRDRRRRESGPYDLVINLDSSALAAIATACLDPRYVVGRCVDADGRGDVEQPLTGIDRLHAENWAEGDLLEKYSGVLRSQHISDIFCAISHFPYPLEPPRPPFARPAVAIPDVLLGLGATRSAKLWPGSYWRRLIESVVSANFTVGIIGAPEYDQRRFYNSWQVENELVESCQVEDLRGKLTLPEVSGALGLAKACVSIDNGIMHLSLAQGTPTIAIFGGSAWQVWTSDSPNRHIVLPGEPCDLCQKNRFRNRDCLLDYHKCMRSCDPATVISTLLQALDQ